uniref:Nuclear receptor n=1 Tax=Brachionus koreanus TaxID=1199090 RepID=A0A221CB69_9BILA|nr:nuclear receptor [Brachionus koreanus]
MDSNSSTSSSTGSSASSYLPTTSNANSYSYTTQSYPSQSYTMPFDTNYYPQHFSSSSSSSSSPASSSPLAANQTPYYPQSDPNQYYFPSSYHSQTYYPTPNFTGFTEFNYDSVEQPNNHYAHYYQNYQGDSFNNWTGASQVVYQSTSQNSDNFQMKNELYAPNFNGFEPPNQDFLAKTNKKCKSPAKLNSKGTCLKRKIKDDTKVVIFICIICEKSYSNVSEFNQICDDCKSFFRRVSKRSTRPNMCQHAVCDLNCENFKFDKCVKMGLCAKIKENRDELNVLFDGEFESFEMDTINLKQVNSFVLNEIENKRQLIRTANSELKVKEYMTELMRNMVNIFHNGQKNGFDETQYQEKISRSLLVAYSFLVDQEMANKSNVLLLLSCQLSPYELKLLEQLEKIYASNNEEKAYVDNYSYLARDNLYPSFGTFDYYQYQETSDHHQVAMTSYECVKSAHLNELKIFHFLLILFSSFLNIDQFMQMSIQSSVNDVDACYCQKLILRLIDNVCKDKVIKTKILLSVSDIDLF